jgi:polyisoprenoid-binding protein YceI
MKGEIMKKAFLLAMILILAVSPMLYAQENQADTAAATPQTTEFYFGQGLQNDVLMVKSNAIFDTRGPLGAVIGFVPGITGEATIWLDSIMLVEAAQVAEEVKQPDTTESPQVDVEATQPDSVVAAESGPIIVPPEGYMRPMATFRIPLANLTTGNPARDELLKSEDYLDVANYPEAVFTLKGIQDPSALILENEKEVSMIASGELTMHGLSKNYANIRVFLTYIKQAPITKKNTELTGDLLHVTAEFTINLNDFAIAIQPDQLLKLDNKVDISVDAFGSTGQASPQASE